MTGICLFRETSWAYLLLTVRGLRAGGRRTHTAQAVSGGFFNRIG